MAPSSGRSRSIFVCHVFGVNHKVSEATPNRSGEGAQRPGKAQTVSAHLNPKRREGTFWGPWRFVHAAQCFLMVCWRAPPLVRVPSGGSSINLDLSTCVGVSPEVVAIYGYLLCGWVASRSADPRISDSDPSIFAREIFSIGRIDGSGVIHNKSGRDGYPSRPAPRCGAVHTHVRVPLSRRPLTRAPIEASASPG